MEFLFLAFLSPWNFLFFWCHLVSPVVMSEVAARGKVEPSLEVERERERDANFSRPKARTAYRPLYVNGSAFSLPWNKDQQLSELVGALGLCFVLFLVAAGEAADHICVFLLRDPAVHPLSGAGINWVSPS